MHYDQTHLVHHAVSIQSGFEISSTTGQHWTTKESMTSPIIAG